MLAQNLDIFKATRMLLSMLLNNTRNVSREVKYLEWSDIRKKCHEALEEDREEGECILYKHEET